MAGLDAFGLVALAAMVAQSGSSAAMDFPCDRLGNQGYWIFERIGAQTEPQVRTAVRLKKGALMAFGRYPLETRWMTLDDAALATDGGKFPAMTFRAFNIGGSRSFCSSTWRETVFGPRQDGTYLIRCLVDEDGDARFESSRAHGELVSYNMQSGKRGKPTGVVPPLRPLPRPVRLVESTPVQDPNAFPPRIISELRVVALAADEVRLSLSSGVATLPGRSGERLRGIGDAQMMTIPLREGRWPTAAGVEIVITRNGGDWFGTIEGELAAAPARLQCGGSVVATGTTFTIMSEGGVSVISGAPRPPS